MELLIFYLGLAIGVSFLCSIMEAVLLSVNFAYIMVVEEKHPTAGKRLRELKNDIDKPLAAILSLNTIAHTIGAAGVGAQAQKVFGEAYLTVVSIILTLLILVFSEIIPKTIGANYWRSIAPFSSRILQAMTALMYPLVVISRYLTRILSKKGDIKLFSREEFSAQIDLARREGLFKEKESRMFKNLIRFGSLRARDIMTPRIVVIAFDEEGVIAQKKDEIEQLRVSRIPVYNGVVDNITGYVLKDDLLISMARGDLQRSISEFRRDIHLLPDSFRLDKLFAALLERQEHIAILIDEYGRLSGLVTLEDVVETLLGMEIVDEVDTVRDMQHLARQQWEERARRLGLMEMSEKIKKSDDIK